MRARRQPEIIAGRVNGPDGAILAGDGFTNVRTGVGGHTLTFAPGFRLVSITANVTAGAAMMSIQSVTGNTANVQVYNTAAALADLGFTFIAVGVQQ